MDRATKEEDDNLEKIIFDSENPEKFLSIGMDLVPEVRRELISFLTNNLDCFAWSYDDMTGISPDVIEHQLNVDPVQAGQTEKTEICIRAEQNC